MKTASKQYFYQFVLLTSVIHEIKDNFFMNQAKLHINDPTLEETNRST